MIYDPAEPDPVRVFITALPYRVRREFSPTWRTRAALSVCARRGDDITDLARHCSKGLGARTRADIAKLLNFRLLREAGLDDDVNDQATVDTHPARTTRDGQ